jgi:hypothetical protein
MDISGFINKIENDWLEIKWSTAKLGTYNISPVELFKESLKLMQHYGFGRLPADVHECLVNLMSHMTFSEGTHYLEKVNQLAFQDAVDYRAFAFSQRVRPEAATELVDAMRTRLDGLSGREIRLG